MKKSVRTVSMLASIQIEDFLNAVHKDYHMSQLDQFHSVRLLRPKVITIFQVHIYIALNGTDSVNDKIKNYVKGSSHNLF
jgi:hypothetical protein